MSTVNQGSDSGSAMYSQQTRTSHDCWSPGCWDDGVHSAAQWRVSTADLQKWCREIIRKHTSNSTSTYLVQTFISTNISINRSLEHRVVLSTVCANKEGKVRKGNCKLFKTNEISVSLWGMTCSDVVDSSRYSCFWPALLGSVASLGCSPLRKVLQVYIWGGFDQVLQKFSCHVVIFLTPSPPNWALQTLEFCKVRHSPTLVSSPDHQ